MEKRSEMSFDQRRRYYLADRWTGDVAARFCLEQEGIDVR